MVLIPLDKWIVDGIMVHCCRSNVTSAEKPCVRFIFVFSVIKCTLTKLGPLLTTHLLQLDQTVLTELHWLHHISEWWWWVCVHTEWRLFVLHITYETYLHFASAQQTHTLHMILIFSLSFIFIISVIYKLLCLSCSATLPEAFHNCINWNPKHPSGNSRSWWTSDGVLWQQQ